MGSADLRICKHMRHRKLKGPTFIDAFAGCGGLSLGLSQAGLVGRLAIEHDAFAFETLKANLLKQGPDPRFSWPRWLPKKPISMEALIADYAPQLMKLRGTIDVLAGGPPCQGFSSAGRRRMNDPRNRLFETYVQLVDLIQPRVVLIENVRGFTIDFHGRDDVSNYSEKLRLLLSNKYEVHEQLIDLSLFGVPQQRTRYFLAAFLPGICGGNPFDMLAARLPSYLRSLGLQTPVSSWSAISDLEIGRSGIRPSSESSGFSEIKYTSPMTRYQKIMAAGVKAPTDLRLARHSDEISKRFAQIIELSHSEGRLNTSISESIRARFNIRKRALRVLDPDRPSPTITSMPDDLLHYREPRTLTVRENARLQGFPDWFAFKGKYTTGGDRRRREVPRFTQVANAVPPLVARAIGELLVEILRTEPRQNKKDTHSRATTQRLKKTAKLVAKLQQTTS